MSTSPGSRSGSRSRSARRGYAAAAASAAVAATHSRHSRQKQCALPQGCSTRFQRLDAYAAEQVVGDRALGRRVGGAERAGLEVVERVLGRRTQGGRMAGVASGGFMCRWTTTPGVHSFRRFRERTTKAAQKLAPTSTPGDANDDQDQPAQGLCFAHTASPRARVRRAGGVQVGRRARKGCLRGRSTSFRTRRVRLGARCRSCSRVSPRARRRCGCPIGGGGDRGIVPRGRCERVDARRGWESVTATAPVSHRAWSAWTRVETRAGRSGPTRRRRTPPRWRAMASRDAKSMKTHKDGDKLAPPTRRRIEPPMAPWGGWRSRTTPTSARAAGGMSAFTPTARLRKRKTLQKRRRVSRADPGAGEDRVTRADCGA